MSLALLALPDALLMDSVDSMPTLSRTFLLGEAAAVAAPPKPKSKPAAAQSLTAGRRPGQQGGGITVADVRKTAAQQRQPAGGAATPAAATPAAPAATPAAQASSPPTAAPASGPEDPATTAAMAGQQQQQQGGDQQPSDPAAAQPQGGDQAQAQGDAQQQGGDQAQAGGQKKSPTFGQRVASGFTKGAAIGTGVDLLSAGGTLGAGTAIGGVLGATGAALHHAYKALSGIHHDDAHDHAVETGDGKKLNVKSHDKEPPKGAAPVDANDKEHHKLLGGPERAQQLAGMGAHVTPDGRVLVPTHNLGHAMAAMHGPMNGLLHGFMPGQQQGAPGAPGAPMGAGAPAPSWSAGMLGGPPPGSQAPPSGDVPLPNQPQQPAAPDAPAGQAPPPPPQAGDGSGAPGAAPPPPQAGGASQADDPEGFVKSARRAASGAAQAVQGGGEALGKAGRAAGSLADRVKARLGQQDTDAEKPKPKPKAEPETKAPAGKAGRGASSFADRIAKKHGDQATQADAEPETEKKPDAETEAKPKALPAPKTEPETEKKPAGKDGNKEWDDVFKRLGPSVAHAPAKEKDQPKDKAPIAALPAPREDKIGQRMGPPGEQPPPAPPRTQSATKRAGLPAPKDQETGLVSRATTLAKREPSEAETPHAAIHGAAKSLGLDPASLAGKSEKEQQTAIKTAFRDIAKKHGAAASGAGTGEGKGNKGAGGDPEAAKAITQAKAARDALLPHIGDKIAAAGQAAADAVKRQEKGTKTGAAAKATTGRDVAGTQDVEKPEDEKDKPQARDTGLGTPPEERGKGGAKPAMPSFKDVKDSPVGRMARETAEKGTKEALKKDPDAVAAEIKTRGVLDDKQLKRAGKESRTRKHTPEEASGHLMLRASDAAKRKRPKTERSVEVSKGGETIFRKGGKGEQISTPEGKETADKIGKRAGQRSEIAKREKFGVPLGDALTKTKAEFEGGGPKGEEKPEPAKTRTADAVGEKEMNRAGAGDKIERATAQSGKKLEKSSSKRAAAREYHEQITRELGPESHLADMMAGVSQGTQREWHAGAENAAKKNPSNPNAKREYYVAAAGAHHEKRRQVASVYIPRTLLVLEWVTKKTLEEK